MTTRAGAAGAEQQPWSVWEDNHDGYGSMGDGFRCAGRVVGHGVVSCLIVLRDFRLCLRLSRQPSCGRIWPSARALDCAAGS